MRSQSARALLVLAVIFVAFNGLLVFLAAHGEDEVPGAIWQQVIGFWTVIGVAALLAKVVTDWVDRGE